MVLDHRHSKGINTVLTPRIESVLEVKISRLVVTSLWFFIRHSKGNNTVHTPRIESVLGEKISRLVATSLWFLIKDTVKGLTPSSLLG